MKYIKLFNEARVEGTRMTQWYQPDQGEELLDFSIDSLAYLMDDGYKVIVETSSDVYDSIRIRKGDDPFVPPYNRQSFNWNEIKDTILPYLIRVNRRYDLEVVTFYTERLSGSTSFTKEGAAKIKDLLEEKTIPLYYDWNSKVDPRSQVFEEIKVKVKKLPLIYNRNESFDRWSRDQKNELEDFCDTHLAYLTDEGFYIDYEELYGGHCTYVTIRHSKREDSKYSNDFSWNEIKDRFIPFLQMLSKEYKLFNFHFEDIACKKDEVVWMDDLLSKTYYSYEDVIEDTINSDHLFYIKLKVGGKIT
jgi:hypothetical protein